MQVLHRWPVLLVPLVFCFVMVQHAGAIPSPDFGVPVTINPVRNEVILEASLLTSEFVSVANVSVRLVSGTAMLTQVQTAVVSIGQRFRDGGIALMQRLVTLATSSGTMGNADAFMPAYQGIDALQQLTKTGFATELANIGRVVPPPSTLVQKFNDAFREMQGALNQLRLSLKALERDIRKSRQHVPARTQSDVTQALIALRPCIHAVRYMVRTTLLYLLEADEFMVDVAKELSAFDTSMRNTLANFSAVTNQQKQDAVQYITDTFGCSLLEQHEALQPVRPQLTAISSYATALQQPLDGILAELGPSAIAARTEEFVQAFDQYRADAVAVSTTSAGLFVRSATAQLLRTMVLTLIAFGPQNEYCFNWFAWRAYSLYALHHNAASKCYEAEQDRLKTMVKFLRHVVDVVLYDVEELGDNLSVCVNLVPGGGVSCVEQQANLYTAVLLTLSKMLDDGGRLIAEEFAVSSARLGACVSSSEQTTLNVVDKWEKLVKLCQTPRNQ
ncbi:uncharacterized protein LOC121595451 [Anopheles merus]|uniref:uncharacterized protein LOC121595451 n=1 Tax=Anopheles merus TaxID=30066 RepID=UPI001BE4510A|nr:uncharacterized protein LOC121595451 [Anopheles merus]